MDGEDVVFVGLYVRPRAVYITFSTREKKAFSVISYLYEMVSGHRTDCGRHLLVRESELCVFALNASPHLC